MAKITKKQQEEATKKAKAEIYDGKTFESAEDLLEQTVMELVFTEPFYANLVMNMSRKFTTEIPTAAVNVTDQVNLYVNPYFFSAMSLPERVDLLKHEAHHVINNHFVRFRDLEPRIMEPEKFEGTDAEQIVKRFQKKFDDMTKASTLNQAADLAINEYLPNLPRKVKLFNPDGSPVCHPATIKDANGADIPNPDANAGQPQEVPLCFVTEYQKKHKGMQHQQNMEYYYEFLKEQNEQDKKNGKGPKVEYMTIDDHSMWHESDASEDAITDKVKEVVNKAVEQTADKDMGKLPGEVKAAIEALNHVPKDWRQEIQRFAARCSEILISSTRKKRNRRYGTLYPGLKTDPRLHLGLLMDTSGSVNDEEVAQFHAEICRLSNLDVVITVVECDSKVQQVFKFDPKKKFVVKGRGGTAFKPAFDEIAKHDVDGIIYFTDGECWGEEIPTPKVPVLWALTAPFHTNYLPKWYNNGSKHAPFTKVEVKKKVRR